MQGSEGFADYASRCVARTLHTDHLQAEYNDDTPATDARRHVCRRERFRAEDGLRRIRYYFICHDGSEQLAVNAKEIKSSGGHYAYHAVSAPFSAWLGMMRPHAALNRRCHCCSRLMCPVLRLGFGL